MRKIFRKPCNAVKNFFCNKYNIIVSIFIIALIIPSIIYPSLKKHTDVDLGENRELVEFEPSFDQFGANFEAYYNDRAPFRSNLIKIYNFLKTRLLKAVSDGVEKLPIVIKNNVIFGKDDWLFYSGDDSERYYTGENIQSEKEMREITDLLIELDTELSKLGKKFILQICPNKEQIYFEYMPTDYKIKTEYKRVDRLVDYIRDNSAVTVSYPKTALLKEKNNYQLYFKTDTHHNNAGA